MNPLQARATGQSPATSCRARAWAWARWRSGSLLDRDVRAGADASPATAMPAAGGGLPGLPHFPAQGKRVIYLFQSGAPSQLDLFDHKPALRDKTRDRAARLGPDGPADHDHDLGPEELSGRPVDLQVRPARPERRLAQRALAAHGRRSPTTSASSARCRPRRSTTTRRSRSSRPARSSPAGRAWASWVTYGLGSENQDLPAFVVLLSRGADRPAALRPPLGQRLPADALPGRQVPRRQEPVLYLANPAGCSPADARGRCSTTSASSTTCSHDETGDPEILTRIAQYELAYRMQTSVPELTDLSQRAEARPRPVRPRRAEARQLRRQLPAGPPAGRARRAVHPALSHGLGPARQPARRRSAASAATPTSPRRPWSTT